MTIQFQCPQCQAIRNVPDEQSGKLGKCPCGVYLRIPAPGPGKKVARIEAPSAIQPGTPHSPPKASQPNPNQAEWSEETRILRSYYLAEPPERKKKVEPSFYSGVATWDATLLGVAIGVLFFGPCLVWYAWRNQDLELLMVGYLASSFWIGLPLLWRWAIRVDWIDAFSWILEKFGFGELTFGECLLRSAYVLASGVATIALLFGVTWSYLFMTGGNNPKPANLNIAWGKDKPKAEDDSDVGGRGTEEAKEQLKPDIRSLEEREQDQWAKLKAEFEGKLVTSQVPTPEPSQLPESWQECVDVGAVRHTEEFLRRFGRQPVLPVASPSLRFVLNDMGLYDMERKTFSPLLGKPFQLLAPKALRRVTRIEISEDGAYLLSHIGIEGQSRGNVICLQKIDHSVMHVFSGYREGHFLPGGTLLLGAESGEYEVVSIGDYSTKAKFSGQVLLGLSGNRKYLAFGAVSGGVESVSTSSSKPLLGRMLELSIYDASTLEKVTSANYRALAAVTRGFFSGDGKKLLLVANEYCVSISLRDGAQEKVFEIDNSFACTGWLGQGSTFVSLLPKSGSKSTSFIPVYDVELGREVLRVTGDSSELFDSMDGVYGRLRNDPANWYRISLKKIEAESNDKRSIARIKNASKGKLKFTMDWEHSEKVKELMRDVVSKRYGVSIIEDEFVSPKSEECIQLDVQVRQMGKANLEVKFFAKTSDGREIWRASAFSTIPAKLNDAFSQDEKNRANVFDAVADSINKVASKSPALWRGPESVGKIRSESALKDCELIAMSEEAQDLAIVDSISVDNSWYRDMGDLDVTRLPLMDYSLPKEAISPDSPSLEVVGFVKDNDEPAILLYHPSLGVSAMTLTTKTVPKRLEGVSEFVQVQAISATNELLILKEDRLLLQTYLSKKKPLVLPLDTKPLCCTVSGNGSVLAVATESAVDFYDLAKFRSKPRDPKLKIFDAQYKLGDGQMRLSPNGRWFAGYEKSATKSGIILDLENGDEQRFNTLGNAKSIHIDDEGQYCFFDEKWRLNGYSPTVLNSRGGISELSFKHMDGLSFGALSLEGKLVVHGDNRGSIEVRSYPSMKVAEELWDPVYDRSKLIQGKMDWSYDGSFFYWNQGERVLVWEASPSSER